MEPLCTDSCALRDDGCTVGCLVVGRGAGARVKPRADFDSVPYLGDTIERNLEMAAQCCIDISNRMISLKKARKPSSDHEAILSMSELGVLSPDFAQRLAPVAGFRNALVHEYLGLDWNQIYRHLQQLDDFLQVADAIRTWLKRQADPQDLA